MLDQNFAGVTAAACKSAHANLLTALVAQRPVTLGFKTYTDCNTIPGWAPNNTAPDIWGMSVE